MASSIDKGSFGGIALAIGGILLGLVLEGGRIAQLLQPTAALIVFGGTLGAVMLQYPLSMVFGAFGNLRKVFFERNEDPMEAVAEMVGYAQKARKEGIVSLDAQLEAIEEPFLKKSLMLAVDGTEPADLRTIMELELDNRAERDGLNAKVFESAGGFSPTIGRLRSKWPSSRWESSTPRTPGRRWPIPSRCRFRRCRWWKTRSGCSQWAGW